MAVGLTQVPLGYQQITSLGSAVGLTVPTGAAQATLFVEGGSIRIRDDGVVPTASIGALIPAGTPFVYTGSLAALQLIGSSGSAGGSVSVLYYR